MVDLRHHYCKECHKITDHIQKTHGDRTATQECTKCHNIVITRKGHNYRRFKIPNKKKKHTHAFSEKLAIVEHTVIKNPGLSKTLKQYDSSTTVESKSQNILVVDDDKILASSFKLILESVGYNVDTAFTGLVALYKMTKKSYDLVILDWNLPDILGDEVAKKIEKDHTSTDIIFITGYSSIKDEVEGQLDKEAVLLKPIIPESLLETATKKLA